jgi:hypothetical protein
MVARVCDICGEQDWPEAIKYVASVDRITGNTYLQGVLERVDADARGFTAAEDGTVTMEMMWAGVDFGFSQAAYSILAADGTVLKEWTVAGTVMEAEEPVRRAAESRGIDGDNTGRIRDIVIDLSECHAVWENVTVVLGLVSDFAPEGVEDRYITVATIINISAYHE